MAKRKRSGTRCRYSDDLKTEAVQVMLDGYSAESVATRLGLSSATLLYRWKANHLMASGPAPSALEDQEQQPEKKLRRVEQERDVLKSLGQFNPEGVTRVYAVIAQLQQENYPTAMLCEVLDVHRSRFYALQRGSIAR